MTLSLADLGCNPASLHHGQNRSLPCPFCNSRTGFSLLWPDQVFKCFSCGQAGRIGGEHHISHQERIERKAQEAADFERRLAKWQRNTRHLFPLRNSPAATYLQSRSIPWIFAEARDVRFATNWLSERPAAMFLLRDERGNVAGMQGRFLERDATPKALTLNAPQAKQSGIFGCKAVWRSPTLAICEAPIDALSFEVLFGIAALAVCGSRPLPDWTLKKLAGKTVILASDNDEAGEECALRWTKQLDGFEVRRIRPSRAKDFNEMLKER